MSPKLIDKQKMWWLKTHYGWMVGDGIPQRKPEHQDPIIVCGVPRSGTSMIAGILSKLGVFVGWRVTDPDENNPRGYYEDREYVELYLSIIHNLTPLKDVPAILDHYAMKRLSTGQRWGWKHNSSLIGVLPWIINRHPDVKLLWCKRPRNEVVPRLQHVWKQGKAAAEQAYHEMNAELLAVSVNTPALVLPFHKVRRNPALWAARICSFCELDYEQEDFDDAVNFVDATQKTF